MNSNKTISANFVRQYTLTMKVSPTGGGTITPTVGTHTYDAGTVVNLTATPSASYRFVNWAGGVANPSSATTTVTMNSNKTISANFVRQYTTSDPEGIACGGTCTASYATGTQVTLTATPDADSVFAGWSGCDSFSGNQCTVTMDSDRTVTASFDPSGQKGDINGDGDINIIDVLMIYRYIYGIIELTPEQLLRADMDEDGDVDLDDAHILRDIVFGG
jgi:hypothetical protein